MLRASAMSNDDILNERRKMFFPISLKLVTMIFCIVLVSLLSVTIAATYFFRNDNKIRALEDTLNYSTLIVGKINSDLNSIMEKGKLAAIIMQGERSAGNVKVFAEMIFDSDPDMIFAGIMKKDNPGSLRYMHNSGYFLKRGVDADFRAIISAEYGAISRSFAGEDVLFNPSFYFNDPVIGLAIPYDRGISNKVIIVFYSMDKILESIATGGIVESFIVSGNGDVIAHRDPDIIKSKTNFESMSIIRMMMTNPNPNAQTSFEDENGVRYLGAFSRTGFSDAAVLSMVNEDIAFAMVYKIQRIVIWLTGIVLSISLLINFFFSRSLSNPIRRLTDASDEIKKGNFDIEISSESRDEIGLLTDSFQDMARGLAEREKIKSAFGKFVNKQIAELVMKKEVKLGGERKDVVVFFADIRSFTEMAETLEPEEVVEFLNQYMTRMVRCITKSKGFVDKYIGDSIMAVWGAPVATGNDAFYAINAALMMRNELIDFNMERGEKGKGFIHIGCGIHSGPVLSGQIGSEERMEYTVIGATVNIASRIEALNKAFVTDILITEETAHRVEGIFRLEPMQRIRFKGKSEPMQIYAVLGRKADPHTPKSVAELRKLLGIEGLLEQKWENQGVTFKEEKYEVLV